MPWKLGLSSFRSRIRKLAISWPNSLHTCDKDVVSSVPSRRSRAFGLSRRKILPTDTLQIASLVSRNYSSRPDPQNAEPRISRVPPDAKSTTPKVSSARNSIVNGRSMLALEAVRRKGRGRRLPSSPLGPAGRTASRGSCNCRRAGDRLLRPFRVHGPFRHVQPCRTSTHEPDTSGANRIRQADPGSRVRLQRFREVRYTYEPIDRAPFP